MPTSLAEGRFPIWAAVSSGGRELGVEFLESLPEKERKRMLRVFEKLAAGHRLSKEDFRKIRDEIWEAKDYQRRMLLFSTASGWCVTHGFFKKTSAATPEREILRAERIRTEHLSQCERR